MGRRTVSGGPRLGGGDEVPLHPRRLVHSWMQSGPSQASDDPTWPSRRGGGRNRVEPYRGIRVAFDLALGRRSRNVRQGSLPVLVGPTRPPGAGGVGLSDSSRTGPESHQDPTRGHRAPGSSGSAYRRLACLPSLRGGPAGRQLRVVGSASTDPVAPPEADSAGSRTSRCDPVPDRFH